MRALNVLGKRQLKLWNENIRKETEDGATLLIIIDNNYYYILTALFKQCSRQHIRAIYMRKNKTRLT